MESPASNSTNQCKVGAFGFTLAEVLITLGLIAIIASFTIPQIMQGSSHNADRAKVLEVCASLSEAFIKYKADNTVTAATKASDLIPYLNSVSILSSGSLDGSDANGDGSIDMTWSCNGSGYSCLQLHNGSYLGFWNFGFGGTSNLHSIWFLLDLDGSPSLNGKPSNTENSIHLVLYTNGQIRSWSTLHPGTLYINNLGVLTGAVPKPASDPSWFKW